MTRSLVETDAIIELLGRRSSGAAFVTEIRAEVGASDVESSLRTLSEAGKMLVQTEPAPDPHLEHFDLRVAALISDGDRGAALAAAREIWGGWVRQFLANHRCQ